MNNQGGMPDMHKPQGNTGQPFSNLGTFKQELVKNQQWA
jgi:hypothetical protein